MMSKRWSEVIASPDYQNLSAQDKAAAQSQYFDSVVKPNLKADEIDTAHAQFYSQYPVGSQEAPQQAKPTEDKDSLSYTLHHPVEAFGALGDALTTGAAKWLLTDRNTGETATPTGAAANWYQEKMSNPETAHNAEVVAKEIPRAAIYGGVALGTEGLGLPLLEGVGVGSRVAPTVARVAGNVAGSTASQESVDNDVTLGHTLTDVAGGELLHGGFKVLGKAGNSIYNTYREVAPESLGGYSQAESAANVIKPEHVERVLQNDNPEAQYNYRLATTDDAGNSILTPSQTMNPVEGKSYIAAEQRNLRRGAESEYQQMYAKQKSGDSIKNAVENPLFPAKTNLQTSADNIVDAYRGLSNDLYNTNKTAAQSILDDAGIDKLELTNTKDLATSHLENKNIPLKGATRKTLNDFKNADINNIETLDNWKQNLSEDAQAAFRAGNHRDARALRSTLNSLRDEADSIISDINPEAGSIYREADKNYNESIGSFGKNSPLYKIANKENPDTAGNILFNNQDAQFNTNQIVDSLKRSTNDWRMPNIQQLSEDFTSAMGQEARNRALAKGASGENFSNPKFANALHSFKSQINSVSHLGREVGAISDQQAINDSLRDALRTYQSSSPVKTPIYDALATGTGKLIGGGAGSAIGAALPIPGGTTLGVIAGQHVGGKLADALNRGVFDEFLGTNQKAKSLINWVSDPVNAKAVQTVIDRRVNSGSPVNDTDLKQIVRTLFTATNNTLHHQNTIGKRNDVPAYVSPEPVQKAQSAKALSEEFDAKTTNLYKSLAHAETGGLSNRFIRTKAAESGVSTAYGPAQLTVNTMKDFYNRHSKMFNAKEREYINAFLKQGEIMKHADKGDPVYGYGGSGTLGDKDNRRMYATVVRKMIQQMIKDNGGSLEKTMHQWRGNDKDTAYFQKVRTHYRSLS